MTRRLLYSTLMFGAALACARQSDESLAATTDPLQAVSSPLARTGSIAESAAGRVGKRLTDNFVTVARPATRINGRIANRVQSRINNRTDDNSDPHISAPSSIKGASEAAARSPITTGRGL